MGAESGDKERDDVIRKAREIADRSNKIFAVHRAGFIERYIQSDGHIAIRRIGTGTTQYGFIIEALPIPHCHLTVQAGVEAYPSWENESVQETAMFPGHIEIMEGAKQIIPSRIWFQAFDSVLIDLGKPLYLFQDGVQKLAVGAFSGRGEKISLAFPDGKIGASGAAIIPDGERTRQQIETASDAMNDDTSLSIDDGVEGLNIREAVKLFAGLRIGVYSDGVGLTVTPSANAFLKNWDLGYGPIDGSLCV